MTSISSFLEKIDRKSFATSSTHTHIRISPNLHPITFLKYSMPVRAAQFLYRALSVEKRIFDQVSVGNLENNISTAAAIRVKPSFCSQAILSAKNREIFQP